MSIGTTTSATTGRKLSYYRCGRGRENDCTARGDHGRRDRAASRTSTSDHPTKCARARSRRARSTRRATTCKRSSTLKIASCDSDQVQNRAGRGADRRASSRSRPQLASRQKRSRTTAEEWELFNAARDWDDLVLDERRRLICRDDQRRARASRRGGDQLARCTITSERKSSARAGSTRKDRPDLRAASRLARLAARPRRREGVEYLVDRRRVEVLRVDASARGCTGAARARRQAASTRHPTTSAASCSSASKWSRVARVAAHSSCGGGLGARAP